MGPQVHTCAIPQTPSNPMLQIPRSNWRMTWGLNPAPLASGQPSLSGTYISSTDFLEIHPHHDQDHFLYVTNTSASECVLVITTMIWFSTHTNTYFLKFFYMQIMRKCTTQNWIKEISHGKIHFSNVKFISDLPMKVICNSHLLTIYFLL